MSSNPCCQIIARKFCGVETSRESYAPSVEQLDRLTGDCATDIVVHVIGQAEETLHPRLFFLSSRAYRRYPDVHVLDGLMLVQADADRGASPHELRARRAAAWRLGDGEPA